MTKKRVGIGKDNQHDTEYGTENIQKYDAKIP